MRLVEVRNTAATTRLTGYPQSDSDNICRKLFWGMQLIGIQQFYPQCASAHYYCYFLKDFTIKRVVIDCPTRPFWDGEDPCS
jgi:hypothetical protein